VSAPIPAPTSREELDETLAAAASQPPHLAQPGQGAHAGDPHVTAHDNSLNPLRWQAARNRRQVRPSASCAVWRSPNQRCCRARPP
jgi:hypothetical protein